MTTTDKAPIADWATDFDHTHPDYAAIAPEVWDELRERCPVAHSDRFGGVWLPTRHEDVVAIAHDTEHFSSEGVIVNDYKPEGLAPVGYAAPITSDPPFHAEARRLLLPAFAPKAIARWEDATRQTCRELIDDLLVRHDGGVVDAARDYAQHIPVRVIAEMLGVPREDGDRFRVWIHRILENPGEGFETIEYEDTLDYYIRTVIEDRRRNPQDDLVSYLLDAEMDGQPLTEDHVSGTIGLLLIAGIDTTWSAIGASLWHLATNPADRARLLAEPELLPTAVEEFLRFYSPVTMARIAATDVEVGGRTFAARDWVLLSFPSANRDPEAFDDADRFVIDRERNRHVAFGVGIHRCAGSNLARLELTIAIDEWLKRVPEFELVDPDSVLWSTGQVRGPRELPVRVLEHREAR